MEKTYQMLWDCTYCGQKKLLGLSHRFCANCGAPQNAALRYFPSDAEKVAVEDHRYAGADVQCPACKHYNSRAANNCVHCGGPMAGGRDAPIREGQSVPSGVAFQGDSGPARPPGPQMPFPQAPAPARGGGKSSAWVVIGVILAVIVGFGVMGLFCWKKSAAFEVTNLTWHRKITIEEYGPVAKKAWCEDVPSGVKITDRSKEKKSSRKIEDGKDCKMVRKDQGDGTFKEKEVCTPKYKEEPIYADRCTYEVNEWREARAVEASGSVGQEPKWPSTDGLRKGSCLGCEREGGRTEDYTVHFEEAQGGDARTCVFADPKRWQAFEVGSRWQGKQSVMTGSIDCDSLTR